MTKEQLNPEQLSAFNGITNGVKNLLANNKYKEVSIEDRIFMLNGGAGCGKTFTTAVLIQEFNKLGYYMRACTPTHKSLAVLDEMIEQTGTALSSSTIHSYLGLKVKEDHNTGKYLLEQSYGNNPPEPVDICLLDECYLGDVEVLTNEGFKRFDNLHYF